MYIIAQTLGAFCAAGVVYGNYYSLIDAYEGVGVRTVPPATNATAGIFATYPGAGVSTVNQFFDQFIASALLVFVIFALKDDSNKGNFIASGAWFPLGLFFLMVHCPPNLPLPTQQY
jgi:aquaglyceroporin related protein